MWGLGAPSRATEPAIATAIMTTGSKSATSDQRSDNRDIEKPASRSLSGPWPRATVTVNAAILGPAIATTLRTSPAVVPIPSEPQTNPSQTVHEIANVNPKYTPS